MMVKDAYRRLRSAGVSVTRFMVTSVNLWIIGSGHVWGAYFQVVNRAAVKFTHDSSKKTPGTFVYRQYSQAVTPRSCELCEAEIVLSHERSLSAPRGGHPGVETPRLLLFTVWI